MGIPNVGDTGLAAIAWVVAGALALAVGGALFGIGAYRRGRDAEARLRQLEAAVVEFCEALRQRLTLASTQAHAAETGQEAPQESEGEAA